MRLKKLKLVGFKSFVDPTHVIFPSNLVAVVGPNGCGKSNIIDAVRWVMGESSAKNLRGESMTDVIFNGSSQRKLVNQASVEMIFDNSDTTLTGEYATYSEIAIKRSVTRDGQACYYLNGTRCRKKDIADIFLGTGLGPRSYAIIGQGTISRLIEAKPEDLRMYLEEAAGISKYKERRRETEIRIGHTRENLTRLNDVCSELGKQLEKLQRQATAALKYKELRTQERLVKAQSYALRWQALQQQLQQQQQKISQSNSILEAQITALTTLDTDLKQWHSKHHTATESFNASQSAYYQLSSDITCLEAAMQHQQQRRHQLEQDLMQVAQELKVAQQHFASDTTDITLLLQEVAALQPHLTNATLQHEALQQQVANAELQYQQWQQQWDDFNTSAAESSKVAHVAQINIQHLEQNSHSQRLRIEKLQQEQTLLDEQELLTKIAKLQQQHAQLQQQHSAISQELQQKNAAIGRQHTLNDTLSCDIDAAKQQQQQLQGELTFLQAMQHAALGKNDDALTPWLQQQQLSDHLRLAQRIQVAAGWETAVEMVLADYLQAICLENFTSLHELLASFTTGNLTLIDGSSIATTTPPPASVLQHKVNCQIPQLKAWLNTIYVADDLEQAQVLLPQLGEQETVITPTGIWLGHGWIRVVKDNDLKLGMLQREQRLNYLQQQLQQQQLGLAEYQQRYQATITQLQQSEQARDLVAQQVNTLHQEVNDVGVRLQVAQLSLAQLQQRSGAVIEELTQQHSLLEDTQQELYDAQHAWQQASQAMEQDSKVRQQLTATREQFTTDLAHLRQQLQVQRTQSQQLTVQHHSMQSRLNASQQQAQRAKERIEALTIRHHSLVDAVAKVQQPDVATALQLQQKLTEHLQAKLALTQYRQQVDMVTLELRKMEQNRTAVAEKSRTIQVALDQLRLEAQTFAIKCATLEESINEIDYTLASLLSELPADANITSWEKRLQVTSNNIQQLGAINLAAIEEYDGEAQRKHYLDAQYQDVTQALETLENAIAKIDRETRQRFKQTYEQVNQGFQDLFPCLFGGGQAYLELTAADLLTTGVSVMARPPGKRNSSIYLLSGGEKAMTAVALVFAIFRLTPSPFCMLDEVDAPLDDANVHRFCAMVKEMSSQVQFIFVTHNKVAMELATHLAGVTMQEPGVSRMVSVDIDHAISLAQV